AVVAAAQAEAAHRRTMRLLRAHQPLHEPDLELPFFGHRQSPRISSTVLPRLAAIWAGVLSSFSPAMVARTTLYGLVDPVIFASTLVTPMTSKIARIGPPAMMPVP